MSGEIIISCNVNHDHAGFGKHSDLNFGIFILIESVKMSDSDVTVSKFMARYLQIKTALCPHVLQ